MITSSPQRLRFVIGCAVVFSLVVLAGCGSGGGKKNLSLNGKVTYKGKPVTGGFMRLTPADGKTQPINCPINTDGTYMAVPPVLGEMKVSIETESMKGQTGVRYPNMKEDKGLATADTSKIAKYVPIPRKYANPQTSNLTVTIQEGKNVKDFDLTD